MKNKIDFQYIDSEKRPWGIYYIIHSNKKCKVKRIEVLPGQKLSYQFHKSRDEKWTIISGSAIVTINGLKSRLIYGESVNIPRLSKHRIENPSDEPLIFIEVQTGDYFGEDDIIRIEDEYNRN